MLVKATSVGLLSVFLAACGIVDTEQAQEGPRPQDTST
ncbi:MAG: hypothetical protein Ct9H300mP19_15150 [Dehalococcoidia bacterium]|nr:MAG: hypothetical protein Ct9H300mP19_15150 [Dehalococcoidia bacterium]